jgi:hypothetical protein
MPVVGVDNPSDFALGTVFSSDARIDCIVGRLSPLRNVAIDKR